MFVLRSKYRDLQARHEHVVRILTTAREQLADFKGAAIRTAGRNTALTEQLETARDTAGVDTEYASQLETRLGRALKACARYRAANRQLERDVARLQQRLDDAAGLNTAAMEFGARWQERRADVHWPRPAEGVNPS